MFWEIASQLGVVTDAIEEVVDIVVLVLDVPVDLAEVSNVVGVELTEM